MSDLDPRKRTILRAVIVEYVTGAEPVGSEMLARKYEFGVRSATIRNEFAELSDMGFLEQPHTSAGRIPSDEGYRYYVDHLIVQKPLQDQTKDQVQTSTGEGEVLQSMLRETTRLLSRVTHLLSAAAIVGESNLRARHAVVTALGPETALLVLVLSNGHVENRMIECPAGLTLAEIGEANEILKGLIEEKPLKSITRIKTLPGTGRPAIDKLLNVSLGTLQNVSRELTRGKLITEGEEFLFGQPEFQRDSSTLAQLLEALNDDSPVAASLVGPSQPTVEVTIGKENPSQQLRKFTVMRRSFYVGEDEAGVLALIGPTRMNYDDSLPLLDFTAKAVSQTLTKLLK